MIKLFERYIYIYIFFLSSNNESFKPLLYSYKEP